MVSRKNPDAVPIRELLGRVIQKVGVSRSAEYRQVFKAWEQVVPESIAIRTRPVSYRNGKLLVVVDSAPLFEEMSCFRQDEFLSLLNGWLNQQNVITTVRNLEFRRK